MTARIGKRLSELLIRDIAEALPDMGLKGMTFKYPDRLTREEAQTLYKAAQSSPYLVAAHRANGTRQHEILGVFQNLVMHFLNDHPADAGGAPAEWPKREVTFPNEAAENPFAHMHPEDAEAQLTWARTRPEYYDAYGDENHPQHKLYVEQTAQIMEITQHAPAGEQDVASANAPAAEAQAAIKQAEANPAYRNKLDPGHGAAVEAVQAAYKAAYPDQTPHAEIGGDSVAMVRRGGASDAPAVEKAAAAGANAKSTNASALARIAEIQNNPAYADKAHPEHANTIAAMSAAYDAAYPSGGDGKPAAGGGT